MEKEVMFIVQADSPELKEVDLNERLMKQIAEASGGGYVHLSEFNTLPSQIKPMKGSVTKTREKPLWDRTSLLAAVLTLLAVEWLTRRLINFA